MLDKARESMEAGVTGLIFGRNVWQRERTSRCGSWRPCARSWPSPSSPTFELSGLACGDCNCLLHNNCDCQLVPPKDGIRMCAPIQPTRRLT